MSHTCVSAEILSILLSAQEQQPQPVRPKNLWDYFKAILQFAGYILTQYWTNHSHFSQYKLFRPQKMEKRAKVKKNASLKCVINSVNTTGTLCMHCTNTPNHQEAVLL